ncbi:MAG: PEP-CTERM sorting domain-containing protein [Desulfuromonadaceae bacterium]|nr:PEP-CTERM sorting domain-containing protein [Desulfuromonadaceae bacterium]
MRTLILITACLGLMALGSTNSAEAYSQGWNSGDSAYMQFCVPSGLNTVISSWLNISANTHGDNNDLVKINGFDVDTLTSDFAGVLPTTRLNVTNFFASYSPDSQPQNVSVNVGGPLSLGPSIITIEYSSSGPTVNLSHGNTAPVPEPETLLLLGSGLSALAFWGKRRKVEV